MQIAAVMLHFIKHEAVFFSFWVVIAACSSSPREDDDDANATSGGGETCHAEVAHMGACSQAQLGTTCPGTASCLCGSEVITADVSCECREGGPLGQSWNCGDDCQQACGGGGAGGTAGTGGSPPALTCADFCGHMLASRCPEAFPDCEPMCQSMLMKPGCESQLQAYFQCVIGAPVICGQVVYVEGCDAESGALTACLG